MYTDKFETVLPSGRFDRPFMHTIRKPKRLKVRLLLELVMVGACTLMALVSLISFGSRAANPTSVTPIPVQAGTPLPTPASTPHERASQVPLPTYSPPPTIEVRRAQIARPDQPTARMPYGETVALHFKGVLPNQEALPWTGNAVGDAYLVGHDYFVWVTPNGGSAQWIDP